jgi:hypothetical protein
MENLLFLNEVAACSKILVRPLHLWSDPRPRMSMLCVGVNCTLIPEIVLLYASVAASYKLITSKLVKCTGPKFTIFTTTVL